MSLLLGALLMAGSTATAEGNCEFSVGVVTPAGSSDIPASVYNVLQKRVESMLGAYGLVSTQAGAAYVINAGIVDFSLWNLPGPPKQTAVSATLLLQLCDNASGTVVSTCTLDNLKGVGSSARQAFTSAMRPFDASNPRCSDFLAGASRAIERYYDSQSPSIIQRAKSFAMRKEYGEALFWLFTIPECCESYKDASAVAQEIYREFVDTEGMKAFLTARAIWIASPDAAGAAKALPVLLTIGPDSAAWEDAEKLTAEIYATVKDDKTFETRTRYRDDLHMEELRIEAAREVGKAWGDGQKESTTNMFVK